MYNKTLPSCHLRNGDIHSRIILWWWQLSEWHSDKRADPTNIYRSYIANGVSAIDCADIYTWVEEAIGKSLSGLYPQGGSLPRIHTKHVPDLTDIEQGNVTEAWTRELILRSLERTQRSCLDLVQFHQWKYDIDTYRISIKTLRALQSEWLIRWIGVTNCSVDFLLQLETSCDFIPLTTQSQYNILDRRPEKRLLSHCKERSITFYAYGSIMGWLLTEKFLWVPEPEEPIENRSIRKYMRIISDWWDWKLFQNLLQVLEKIGATHGMKIGDVAIAWVLWRLDNGAVITGARNTHHAEDIAKPFSLVLNNEELSMIDEVYKKWNPIEWDCFDIERYAPRHRDIMKFNLNTK